jgi:hypothetical protein
MTDQKTLNPEFERLSKICKFAPCFAVVPEICKFAQCFAVVPEICKFARGTRDSGFCTFLSYLLINFKLARFDFEILNGGYHTPSTNAIESLPRLIHGTIKRPTSLGLKSPRLLKMLCE